MICEKNLKTDADWPLGVATGTKVVNTTQSLLMGVAFKNGHRLAPLVDRTRPDPLKIEFLHLEMSFFNIELSFCI